MGKRIIRAGAFLLILVLLMQLLGLVFRPKDNTKAAGFRYDTAVGFLAEPENTLDVAFLGDSRAHAAFVPLKIWEDYGITSFTCATPAEYLTDTYTTLETFLERQNPKVVVLETNILYQPCYGQLLLTHALEQVFPFLEYHDRWKTLTWSDWISPVDYHTFQRDKGYGYSDEVQGTGGNDNMAPSEDMESPVSLNVMYLRKLRDLCRQEDVQLILFTAPTTREWYTARHNGVSRLAQELQIPYMDGNLMMEEIPVDWSEDTYDEGDHLNYSGASKNTEFIGKWLWDLGIFSDKRQLPEYAAWNASVEAFYAGES